MKLPELKELAQNKNLLLHKYGRQYTRNQCIYSKEENVLDQNLISIKKVPYMRYTYLCRTREMPEHQNYKITGKDYKELLTNGAKEEE